MHNNIGTRFKITRSSGSEIFKINNIHVIISELDRNRKWINIIYTF